MDILGVRIDNLDKKEILEKLEFFLIENKFHQIATINPEFILRALRDNEFKCILNECAFNIADGIGLKYAFVRYFSWLKLRMAGVELMEEILQIANQMHLNVYLAVTTHGLSSFKLIKKVLTEKYPNIKFFGSDIDPKKTKKWPKPTDCEIVFCNFGFPQQEKFLNSVKNDTIRLAMGVGGSFDFITGKVMRAPVFLRQIGMEWFWRLLLEPRYRLKRVVNAVIIFPIRIIIGK